jgi:hypothetical protein
VTALRILLAVVLVGSAAVVAYGLLLDRSGQAIAFTVAGLFVLGVTLALTGLLIGTGAIGQGRAGRGVRATAGAFVGGLFLLAAAGSLAGAVVLAVLVGTI